MLSIVRCEVFMAATKAPKERAPRRRWPAAEKRRIVELKLHIPDLLLMLGNGDSPCHGKRSAGGVFLAGCDQRPMPIEREHSRTKDCRWVAISSTQSVGKFPTDSQRSPFHRASPFTDRAPIFSNR